MPSLTFYFRSRDRTKCLVTVVVLSVLWVGCDPTVPMFENPEDSPLYFSLYGQVAYPGGGTIRVEPLRDAVPIGAPKEVQERVIFTEMATGRVDTLRISSRRIGQLPVHHYRTPSSLSAGATYQIEVSDPQGGATSVMLSIPEQRPEVRVLDTLRYCGGAAGRWALPLRVRINAVEHLGRVAIRYETQFGRSAPYRWTNTSEEVDERAHLVTIDPHGDLVDITAQHGAASPLSGPPLPAVAQFATVTVVAVGPGWPGRAFNMARLEEIAIPKQYSNVRQGVGLVVGTYPVEVQVPVEVPDLDDLPLCP